MHQTDKLHVAVTKIKKLCQEIYDALGSGHSESVYQEALAISFRQEEISYAKELTVELHYKKQNIGYGAADFVVYIDDLAIVLELKTAEKCNKGQKQQLRCYKDALKADHGMLINFWKPGTAQATDDGDLSVIELDHQLRPKKPSKNAKIEHDDK
jgi:GxxExxY protein